jgi:hypothetical protein
MRCQALNSEPLPKTQSSIAGLRVVVADDCRGIRADGICLSREVVIGERDLWCADCGAYRKKLSTRAATFLAEIINEFGRPVRPITLRRAIGFICSPDLIIHENWNPAHILKRRCRMDMRQYGQVYLQPDELKDEGGPRQDIIAEIRPPDEKAKYPKPIAIFKSAKMVLLNKTSVSKLMVEFGISSDDWIGKIRPSRLSQRSHRQQGHRVDRRGADRCGSATKGGAKSEDQTACRQRPIGRDFILRSEPCLAIPKL